MPFQLGASAPRRALYGALLVGVILGLSFGAACLAAGATQPDQNRAEAFARAAQKGYAAGAVTPPPAPVRGAPPIAQGTTPQAAKPGRTANARELHCLADAVYYEARGEGSAGQAAVAQVVLNRVRQPAFPGNVCAVVYQGARLGECQFSFVCNGAMRGRLDHTAWIRARQIAARALSGYVMAAVGRATFFHAAGSDTTPRASGGVRLGGHVFYASFRRPVERIRVARAKSAEATPVAPPAVSFQAAQAANPALKTTS